MTDPRYGAGKTGEPAFAERGIVEGFYGRPWSHEQRLDMIRFIGARGMNRFVYAPKDDPLMRREWARPYDTDDLARIAELADACVEHGVELVYCISPGLSIRYSSAGDSESLIAKLRSVAAVGVGRFGLLLDDVPARLQHPEDMSRFDTLAQAQRELANTVYAALRGGVPGAALVVCPTEYWGYGDEPYLVELAAGLHPEVDLFWTGRAICSATIDAPDAERFAHATGRAPLYWDNYPVNDVAMGDELHIGPYRGRSPELDATARGVIANGMELFESSKIAFATIADFLWSPRDYDPEASWDVALRDVVGPADADAFRDFADNVRSSCLSAHDAPQVTEALEDHDFATLIGDKARAVAAVAPLAARLRTSADHLLSGRCRNDALVAEARPWLESFEIGVRALEMIGNLTERGRLAEEGPAALSPLLAELRMRHRRVFGDVMDMTLDGICSDHNTTSPKNRKTA
jgi:hyaluronoglucosaminidase